MSSSSTKSNVPLVRTRRARSPRRRSRAPAPGTAPGRGPVDIRATVAGVRACYGPAAEGRVSAAGAKSTGNSEFLAVRVLPLAGRAASHLVVEIVALGGVLGMVAGPCARAGA